VKHAESIHQKLRTVAINGRKVKEDRNVNIASNWESEMTQLYSLSLSFFLFFLISDYQVDFFKCMYKHQVSNKNKNVSQLNLAILLLRSSSVDEGPEEGTGGGTSLGSRSLLVSRCRRC